MDFQQDLIFGLIFMCGVILAARIVDAIKMHQVIKEETKAENARLMKVEELYGRSTVHLDTND